MSLMSCSRSMVLAYKGLYENYWVYPSIKSDIKGLSAFCFQPPPPPVWWVSSLRKVEMVPGVHTFMARGLPVTDVVPLNLLSKEQAFYCLSKFTGKPFPAEAQSTSDWPWKYCEGFCWPLCAISKPLEIGA